MYGGCDIRFLILDVSPLDDYSIEETIIRHYRLKTIDTYIYFNHENIVVTINSYLKQTYYNKDFFDIKKFIEDVKTPNVTMAAYMTRNERSAMVMLRSLPIYLRKTCFGTIFKPRVIPQYRKEVMKLQRAIKKTIKP